MKIVSTPYTHEHGFRALKRLHKAIIRNQLLRSDLHKLYQAMLHLERYMERLSHSHRNHTTNVVKNLKDPLPISLKMK